MFYPKDKRVFQEADFSKDMRMKIFCKFKRLPNAKRCCPGATPFIKNYFI